MTELRVIVIKAHGVIAPFVMDGYANGFKEAGHKVLLFDTVKDRFDANKMIAFSPDFVIAYGYCGFIKTEHGFFFREHKIPLVCLHYDCPYLGRDEDKDLEISEYQKFYYEFVWDKWFLSELRNHGAVNNSHIFLATDSGLFFPDEDIEALSEPSISFVGRLSANRLNSKVGVEVIDNFIEDVVDVKLNNFSMPVMDICKIYFQDIKYDAIFKLYNQEPSKFWKIIYRKIHGLGSSSLRRHIIESINWVDLHIYGAGDGWKKDRAFFHENIPYGRELSKAYQKYALNLNITSLQLETSINNRPFDAYASKAFMLNDYRDDIAVAFPDHWEMITYKNLNELTEKGEYFLTHEKERLELLADLNDVTLKKHTYKNRAVQIVDTLYSENLINKVQDPHRNHQNIFEQKIKVNKTFYTKVEACPVCRGIKYNFRFFVNGHGGFKSNFYKCTDCQTVFLNPCPSDEFLDSFYNNIYYSAEHRRKMGWSENIDRVDSKKFFSFQRRMDFVEKFVDEDMNFPRGKLLDVGCSTGKFLFEARSRYWDVMGIEISDKAAEVGRKSFNLPVDTGVLDGNRYEKDMFDVVTAWDVVEHIPKPEVFMTNINRVLKENGLFVLNTPNVNSLAAIFSGEKWRHLDAPLHPVLYDFVSIRLMLLKYGFKCLEVSSGEEYLGQMKVAAQKIGVP